MILDKIKDKWQIKSNFQLVVIFIVFAINGSMSAKIGFFLMKLFNLNQQNLNYFFYYLVATLIITLIYPFLLIAFGFVFGQFEFFFRFSRKMLQRIGLGFVFGSKKNPE